MRKKILLLTVFTLLVACTNSSSGKTNLGEAIGNQTNLAAVSGFYPSLPPACDDIYQEALAQGIGLPLNFRPLCPGLAQGYDRQHWGITCFSGVGPEGQCPYISVNLNLVGSNRAKQKYVIFHELCHANGSTTERAADQCAFAAGASSRYSPY